MHILVNSVSKSAVLILTLGFFLVSCADITMPGQYRVKINHDGLDRSFELHVPAGYDGSVAVPLLFDLHPVVINGNLMDAITDFRALSDVEGFIVVQPNGIGGSWNAGPKCCAPANVEGYDDIGLIRAIRDELIIRGLNIDLSNVYSDGMSNGGYLSHTIACEDSELVTAIAGVVSSMAYPDVDVCQPTKPMPLLMISGGQDNIADRQNTFNKWVALNNCVGSPTTEEIGVFTCTTYDSCDDGVETTHCVGAGGGHCWPGTDFLPPCSQDLNATQYIWNFFQRNSN
ncbi:alpha/beta hydrolase family esterase [Thermodesulfobacteriota bacterium]